MSIDETALHPHETSGESAILDEPATFQDSARPGTVSAAADQPHLVKAGQREAHLAGEKPNHHQEKAPAPWKLTGATWRYSLKRSVAEFSRDQCSDIAAALTYYSVLSVFPALIAGVSLLSLVGEAERTQEFILEMFREMVDASFVESIEPIVEVVTATSGAGIGLVVGILAAMWTASNYVNAFSRAMNRIYETEEGRSVLVLRPLLYAVTAGLILMVVSAAMMLVVSGPVVEALGNVVGMGDAAMAALDYATIPSLLLVAALCIALLYYCTPNIGQPGAKWVLPGALAAILVMSAATVGVGFYVGNFASYEATYGALAGVIIFLFWIYIMNMVLLFGAQLNSELERGRQLQAGIEAERTVMLPERARKGADKKAGKYEKVVASGQALRLSKGTTADTEDAWRR